jgi:hypothetical protein
MYRIIAAVCLVSVGACASGDLQDETTSPPPQPTEVTVTVPTTTTTTSSRPTTPITSPGPRTPSAGDAGAAACVVGEWELDTTEFESRVEEFYALTGMETIVSITAGRVLLNFEAGGMFVGGYDELTVDLTVGQGLPDLTVTFGGVVSGSYSVADDRLVLVPDDQSTFTATVEIGGLSVSPDAALGLEDVDVFSESASTVACANDGLSIQPEGAGPSSRWTRR